MKNIHHIDGSENKTIKTIIIIKDRKFKNETFKKII